MSAQRDQKRLGRGLAALLHGTIEPAPLAQPDVPVMPPEAPQRTAVRLIRCDVIRPNPFQPRSDWPEASLESLADHSLKRLWAMQMFGVRHQRQQSFRQRPARIGQTDDGDRADNRCKLH